ncbi:MAG: Holliday junction resolvase RuvX [Planctomycetes bacterium]|jgi:putative Holliday junction resolvase|nr:Holliday junction resolvase RuvX [Planctomycetota bacterium]
MSARRFLALDVGERRTGVAATDWTGTICVPLDRIDHSGMKELPDRVAPLLAERQSEVLVVGVPLGRDGAAGPQARKVLALVDVLRKRFQDLEIMTVDEAHTTDEAHRLMKDAGIRAARRRRHADSLSALQILRRVVGD